MTQTGTNPDISVLFEDNHLLVVLKPAGLLSQQDRTGAPDLLTICKGYLKQKYDKPGAAWLGLLHRIDRPVGGVMVLAKTSKAAARISRQIRERTFGKEYLLVCRGKTPPNAFLVHHLQKDAKTNRVRTVDRQQKGSQKAELSYLRKEYLPKQDLSLLQVNLITGRPHQIRVQLASSGHPLFGDKKYSFEESGSTGPALFASGIRLIHPVSGEHLHFQSQPPDRLPWSLFRKKLS